MIQTLKKMYLFREPVNPLGKFGIQVQDRYEDI